MLWCQQPSANFEILHHASPTMQRRDGQIVPQTTAESLSHNAKTWRIDKTHARMKSAYFEFLSIRRETGIKQSKVRRAWLTRSLYFWWPVKRFLFLQKAHSHRIFLLSHHIRSMQKKSIVFSFFLCTLMNTKLKKKQKKIVEERTSTFLFLSNRHQHFYCAGTRISTSLARWFLLCWHGNFYCSQNIS